MNGEERGNGTIVEEYRNHKIEVNKYGQFQSLDEDIPTGDLRQVRYYIDVIEEWKRTKPVKLIRAEYPYLQIIEARRLRVKQSTGRYKKSWFVAGDMASCKMPWETMIGSGHLPYSPAVYSELKILFSRIKDSQEGIQKILKDGYTEWNDGMWEES
jgi:hypothetical protein